MSRPTEKRKVDSEHRKFHDEWTDKYCFVNNNNVILCLLCNCTVAVSKEYNLKRHYETKHSAFSGITGDERTQRIASLRQSLQSQQKLFVKHSAELEASVEVSFLVAHLIAKSGRPFTDGDFVKECILLASEKLCPEAKKKFQALSLNRMTIQRRVAQLSDDLCEQLENAAKNFQAFSLALDESTDIASTAQLIVFVRGVSADFCVTEALVGLASLTGTTTGKDILTGTLNLCKKLNLEFDKLASVTTDGAPSLTGSQNGMVTLLKEKVGDKDFMQFHCIIHQQQLCAKQLGFQALMKVVSDSINFIRSHGLNHHQFKEFLEELESSHPDVHYYTEVRWLSRGKALRIFTDLLEEVIQFLEQKEKPVRRLKDPRFQCDLAFLTDITGHLNNLNLKLQGKSQFINKMYEQVQAFRKKLQLFESQFKEGNLFHFEYCKKFQEKHPDMKMDYSEQIHVLINVFADRFCDFTSHETLFQLFGNPFGIDVHSVPEMFQLELIDLQASDDLKIIFNEQDILSFYKQLPKDTFPNMTKNAATCASMFGSTYICEQTFSILNLNKCKLRSRLTDNTLESILHISTSSMEPDVKKIVANMQLHPSH